MMGLRSGSIRSRGGAWPHLKRISTVSASGPCPPMVPLPESRGFTAPQRPRLAPVLFNEARLGGLLCQMRRLCQRHYTATSTHPFPPAKRRRWAQKEPSRGSIRDGLLFIRRQ